jgi:uncharacterized coiled-coil protein SlyX
MSDEWVTLELLGGRTLAMGAELRDLQLRFGALESRFAALETTVNSRFGALESRFAAQEERMNRLIALVVRIAERLEGGASDERLGALEARVRTRMLFKAGRRDGPMTEYDGDGNPIARTMFSVDRQVGERQSLNGNAPASARPWYQHLTGGL